MLNIARIYLVGLWVEAVLWGMNVLLIGLAVHVLVFAKKSLHWLLLPSCLVMFSLATTQVMLSLTQLIQGFTGHPSDEILGGAQIYFGAQNKFRNAQYFIYATSSVLADILLIWRLYVVWGYNLKIIIIPAFLETVGTACSFTAVVFLTRPGGAVFSPNVHHWGVTSWSMNLVVNIIVPFLIAYRLMWANRRLTALGSTSSRYTPALRTIVESGMIYATAILVMFSLSVAGNPINAVGIQGLTQLATLVPLIIVVRAGLGLADSRQSTTVQSTKPSTYRAAMSPRNRTEIQVLEETTTDYPLDAFKQKRYSSSVDA